MALPGDIKTREHEKFREGRDGTAVAIVADGGSIEVETAGVQWTSIITTLPASNVEVFTYYNDATVVQIVTVTYESSAKKTPLSVFKQRF